jgi:hypothetical protein
VVRRGEKGEALARGERRDDVGVRGAREEEEKEEGGGETRRRT